MNAESAPKGYGLAQTSLFRNDLCKTWLRWISDGKYFSVSSSSDKNYDPKNWKTWIVSLDDVTQADVTKNAGIMAVSWRS